MGKSGAADSHRETRRKYVREASPVHSFCERRAFARNLLLPSRLATPQTMNACYEELGRRGFSPRRYDATGRGWESNRDGREKPGCVDSRNEKRWFGHAEGKTPQSILAASFAPLRETSSSPPDLRLPKRWVPAIVSPRVSRQGATTQREEVGNRIEVEGESRDPRTLATKRGGSDMPKGRHSSQSSLRA
ncbi:hypothetical protein VN12_17915 [Pirellula sp. SH-Sr6A]|nr:hypothetical protein VN12_17915 [Pirellula sp. SH-Sr6A]